MPYFRASDQTELFYRDHGDDAGVTPLLLLHGFPFDGRLWERVAPILSANGRVLLPDLRGFGRSGRPAGPYTAERFARDAVDLLDTLGIPRAFVGGHSMGGYAALAMAEYYPDRIAGLALLHSHPFPDDEAGRRARYELAENIFRIDRAQWARTMREKLTGPNFGDADGIRLLDDMFSSAPPQTVAACATGMALRPDRSAVWRRFEGKTLFVHGTHDGLIGDERAAAIRHARDLQPIQIDASHHDGWYIELSSGHTGMLEQPERFASAVSKWWTES